MTKKICDRCGKEIKMKKLTFKKSNHYDISFDYTLQKWGLCGGRYELCHDCAKEFLKFMNRDDHFICTSEAEDIN